MKITSGLYKGRKIECPKGDHIRPTSNRMRQSLFNILKHSDYCDLDGARILDVFCGTGALGVEALSHGAEQATFMDLDITTVQKNTAFLSDADYQLIKTKLPPVPKGHGDINLVFMDPPYNQNLIEPTIEALIAQNWLVDQAIFVIETEKNAKLQPDLTLLDQRDQGRSTLSFYQWAK